MSETSLMLSVVAVAGLILVVFCELVIQTLTSYLHALGHRVDTLVTFGSDQMSMSVYIRRVADDDVLIWYCYRSQDRVIGEEEVWIPDVSTGTPRKFFPGPKFPFPGVNYKGVISRNPHNPKRFLVDVVFTGKGGEKPITGIGWGT